MENPSSSALVLFAPISAADEQERTPLGSVTSPQCHVHNRNSRRILVDLSLRERCPNDLLVRRERVGPPLAEREVYQKFAQDFASVGNYSTAMTELTCDAARPKNSVRIPVSLVSLAASMLFAFSLGALTGSSCWNRLVKN
jgi:hypothetical protein